MKKILKRLSSNLIIFGVFLLVGGILIVRADILSRNVDYDNSTSGMSATTVEGALNELHDLVDEIEALKANVSTPVGQTIYSSPQILYLDPTNLQKICREIDTTKGSGNNTCMRWYIYAEDDKNTQDISDDIYIAILDHNTTETVSNWSTALTQVDTDSSTWQTVLSSDSTKHARLITGQEVADIVGNTTWTSSGSYVYFEGSQLSGTGTSKYAWLFDYTYSCTSYGCNTAYNNDGYWTSTAKDASHAWYVVYLGSLAHGVSYSLLGVRPVIEIPKSVLLNRN